MKSWTFAALLSSMIIVPLVLRLKKLRPAGEQVGSDRRYAIDDLIADQPLS